MDSVGWMLTSLNECAETWLALSWCAPVYFEQRNVYSIKHSIEVSRSESWVSYKHAKYCYTLCLSWRGPSTRFLIELTWCTHLLRTFFLVCLFLAQVPHLLRCQMVCPHQEPLFSREPLPPPSPLRAFSDTQPSDLSFVLYKEMKTKLGLSFPC